MKKFKISVMCLLLSSSMLFTSCIGSFSLWNSLKDWNEGIGDKFVNEIVFLAFNIVPVYPVAYFADIVLLNSIEFWTGSNPLASTVGTVKTVHGNKGDYLVQTNKDGYTITKKGDTTSINLVYDKAHSTWNVKSDDGKNYEIARINHDGSISVKNAQGEELTVQPNKNGVAQMNRFLNADIMFAAR